MMFQQHSSIFAKKYGGNSQCVFQFQIADYVNYYSTKLNDKLELGQTA
jgi:hypothetical protein